MVSLENSSTVLCLSFIFIFLALLASTGVLRPSSYSFLCKHHILFFNELVFGKDIITSLSFFLSPSFPSFFVGLHTRTVVQNWGGASRAAYGCGSGVDFSLPSPPHTPPYHPPLFPFSSSDFVFLHSVYIHNYHHSLHTRLCSI